MKLICLTVLCWHPGALEKVPSLLLTEGQNSSVCGTDQRTSRQVERRNIYTGQKKEAI